MRISGIFRQVPPFGRPFLASTYAQWWPFDGEKVTGDNSCKRRPTKNVPENAFSISQKTQIDPAAHYPKCPWPSRPQSPWQTQWKRSRRCWIVAVSVPGSVDRMQWHRLDGRKTI